MNSNSVFSYRDSVPELASLDHAPTREVRRKLWTPPHDRYPRFLYKYRACNTNSVDDLKRIEEILVESKLWVSSPSDFNDPFDMSASVVFEGTKEDRISAIVEKLTRLKPYMSIWRKQAEAQAIMMLPSSEIERNLLRSYSTSIESLGICSFSKDVRSILMWSHYAGNHSGVAIQFELALAPSHFLPAGPVEYSSAYPTINWNGNLQTQLTKMVLRKSLSWAYEREHRLILPDYARSHFSFPAKACVGVVLGCNASDATKSFVRVCNEKRVDAGQHPLKIYQAIKSSRQYKLRLSNLLSNE